MKMKNIWLVSAPILILVISILSKSGTVQTIASVSGVIYVLLIGRENKLAYVFGVVNVLLYATQSWNQGLIGSSVLNIITSIPVLIYGYIYWNKTQGQEEGNIKKLSKNNIYGILISTTLAMVIYYLIIIRVTPVSKAIIDTIVAIVSIIGNLLMARKYFEQWWCWIIVNASNVLFWAAVCAKKPELLPLMFMWIIYLCNTLVGMTSWKNKMKSLHK